MAINSKNILQKGHSINDKCQVTFFLKKGSYAETYRVKGKQGKTHKNAHTCMSNRSYKSYYFL